MGITKYQRGAETERKIVALLELAGYTEVTRSAGSHGAFDVWALNEDHTLLIQSKRCKKFSASTYKEELKQIKEKAKKLHKQCQVEFWIWEDFKGFVVKEVIKKAGENVA